MSFRAIFKEFLHLKGQKLFVITGFCLLKQGKFIIKMTKINQIKIFFRYNRVWLYNIYYTDFKMLRKNFELILKYKKLTLKLWLWFSKSRKLTLKLRLRMTSTPVIQKLNSVYINKSFCQFYPEFSFFLDRKFFAFSMRRWWV